MNKLTVNVTCVYCDCDYSIDVNEDDYMNWKNGEGFIQDLLPYLTAAQRELLISKTCDDCWEGLFGTEDDDEDEYCS